MFSVYFILGQRLRFMLGRQNLLCILHYFVLFAQVKWYGYIYVIFVKHLCNLREMISNAGVWYVQGCWKSYFTHDHTKRFQTISWNISKCHVCFNFVRNTHTHIMDTWVCPSVHVWTKTKNTQVMVICVQVFMHGLFILSKHHFCGYFFGTVHHFVAILFVYSHRKPIATQEKDTHIYGQK